MQQQRKRAGGNRELHMSVSLHSGARIGNENRCSKLCGQGDVVNS